MIDLCTLKDEGLLTDEELKHFNDYHEMVYNRLSDFLNEEEKVWLKEATSPLKR